MPRRLCISAAKPRLQRYRSRALAGSGFLRGAPAPRLTLLVVEQRQMVSGSRCIPYSASIGIRRERLPERSGDSQCSAASRSFVVTHDEFDAPARSGGGEVTFQLSD
jgi:hypothetical protein